MVKTRYVGDNFDKRDIDADGTKLDGIASGSDVTGDNAPQSHNHPASEVTDFDTEVENNTAVTNNTAKETNATHTGDVTGDGALTITDGAVTYAKMQNVVSDERILGRVSGANGVIEELTKTQALTLLGLESTDFLLTVPEFQTNPGTGTAASPEQINDNNTTTQVWMNAVDKYVEVDFGSVMYVNQYRLYGYATQSSDGVYIITYWDGSTWVDSTEVSTRTASWSDWILLTNPIATSKIRLKVKTLDSYAFNVSSELEMKGEFSATALAIDNDAITYAKIQNIVDNERILGRVSGANGVVEELTPLQVSTMIQNVPEVHTPSAAATATLNLNDSKIHDVTMPAGNVTLAISNEINGYIFSVNIIQDSTGSRTITWFTGIKWENGTVPTLTTAATKIDTFIFRCTGTDTYLGYIVGQNI